MTQDKVSRIANILNLTTTKNRENTISSFAQSILYAYKDDLSLDEILSFTEENFNLKLIPNEAEEVIRGQVDDGVLRIVNGKYKLSEDRLTEIRRSELQFKQRDVARFLRFQELVNSIALIEENDLKLLWETFEAYLIECFYQYGENALNSFHTIDENADENLNDEPPFKTAVSKLRNPILKDIFKNIVVSFPSKLSVEDLDYLESLAKKTVSFYSLGLPKDLYEEITDTELIDWTVFVDTNFLYSILDLHSHPEDSACKELLTFVKDHRLNIRFRFIPTTMKELKQKKSDFESVIPKITLRASHIAAALESGRLDSFSKRYYQRLQQDSDTLHPSEIIDTAERVLMSIKGIGLHNININTLDEKYLNIRIQEYEDYLRVVNQVREDRGYQSKYKNYEQVKHDIVLREVIDMLGFKHSDGRQKTFSELKFLGLTLDKLLINFDRYQLSKTNKGYIIPTFFLPSFILNRLYRLIPVQTQNYKQAFITAIATFSFSEGTQKSRDVQKFIKYYREQGLEDEKLLLGLITDDIFLNSFFEEEEGQARDEFVESEINKKIKAIQDEKDMLVDQLKNTDKENESVKHLLNTKEQVVEGLKKSEQILLDEIGKLQESHQSEVERVKSEHDIEKRELAEKMNRLEQSMQLDREIRLYNEKKQSYDERKQKFIQDKWEKFKHNRFTLIWFTLLWSLVPLSFICISKIEDINNPNPNLKYILSGITSFISFIISILNKNNIEFSFNYLRKRTNTKNKKLKEFEKAFTEVAPQMPQQV